MKKRVPALILALACLLALLAPGALAAETEENVTIHIRSLADLRKLAANCSLDTYSDHLTVILDTSLNLNGESFSPIPIFNGTFEGNHYSITGLSLASDGSNQGLFRYLYSDAEVRNLVVSGTIAPTIGQEHVGGIAGTNFGEIRNCSFEGEVSGVNYIGGIAGENSGVITGCSVRGSVSGKRFTGGIAGHNTGLITSCTNNANVNTEINEVTLGLDSLNNVSTTPLALLNAEDENIVSDSGGIVGYSKGVVQSCVNHGTIGYQHYGYNVGGIAGRQAGYLDNCENYGDVLGRKDVAGIVGQMEPFLELVASMNLADELVLLNNYMNAASGDLAYMSEQMQYAMDSGSYAIDSGSYDYENIGGTITHEGEDPQVDTGGGISSDGGGTISPGEGGGVLENLGGSDWNDISNDMSGLANNINEIYGIMSDSAGYLSSDLHMANDQFSRVLMLMSNAIGGNPQTDIFEDVSGDLNATDVEGRVSNNLNLGRVDADNNVGGVVGAMGIEYEFDMEDTLAEKVGANGIVNNTYDAKCICADNTNRGAVLSKKDRVGGVVGSSEMGTIRSSQSYGSVESSEGGYVGGVVGYSECPIQECYAMCDLKGSQYVGGIVGYGAGIVDCVSMVETGPASACLGAIAGWTDMTVDAVDRNVFVHDTLGAVDGISYAGLAMPVSYEELMQRESLPNDFKALKLSFLADGVLVKELSVPYGSSVSSAQIPAVPAKAGYSGVWEEFEMENLRFSTPVEAVYTPLQSALASEETREDSPMSIVLVEGEFDDNVIIHVEPYADVQADESVLESWQLRLENLENASSVRYNVRYQIPTLQNLAHKVEIQQLVNGSWRHVDVTENSSYVSFPVQGDTVVFRAVEVNRVSPKLLVLAAAAGVSLIGLIAILSISRRSRKKGKH